MTPKTESGPAPGAIAASACLEPYLEAWNELEDGDEATVVDVLRTAAERHGQLIADAGLEDDAPADWEERAERLLEYRRKVDADILTPLGQAYRNRGPTATIDAALRKATESANRLSGALPESIDAPWANDALDSQPSDSFGRLAGKSLARVFSGARAAGRERPLPLRNVTMRHLVTVVAPGQDASGAEALAAWARWSQRLEVLWSEWGTSALPSLVRADRPGDERDEADETDESDEAEELWTTIREAARELQVGLEALVSDDPGPVLAAAARIRLDEARAGLESDLAVAGSFLLNPSTPPRHAPSLPRTARMAVGMREWEEQMAARLRLYRSLLAILSGATAVQRRMVWRFRDRCLSSLPVFADIADRLGRLGSDFTATGPSEAIESRLSELGSAVDAAVDPARGSVPEPHIVDSAIREISDSTIEALSAMIRQAPAELVLHAPGSKVPVGGRRPETRTVQLQELARQSFDALRIERIRSATSGLPEAVDEARANVAQLDEVYSFALDEVDRELESDGEGARERVADLIRGALKSIADSLRTQLTNVDTAVAEAQDRLATEISDGSTELLDRVEAGRMEAGLFAARSLFTDVRAWLNRRLGPPLERVSRFVALQVTRLRRFGRRVLRKGSAMVGSAPAETAASARALRALADPQAATAGLPLVYQRLFTLDPVSDPALLAARESELAAAIQRWKRWRDTNAGGVPLIVRGRQGSGITSFLNALGEQIEADGGSIVRSSLKERITSEAPLAAQLAASLGLDPEDSLDGLAEAICAAAPDSLPGVVELDNLEHLYLRVPRGTDLVERLLTLMSETEPQLFWVGGVTASAWQIISAAEPTAVSQVDVLELPPLTTQGLQAAVKVRHRRSGLAIRYEESTSARHLLRRRIRRIRDAEGYRQLLEDDYFNLLFKASGGHIALALHQWLVAADFTSGDGVYMRQPERPDFSVLEALDLTQNFTLKAFLEHRSLTLDEHDRIFRMARQESFQIFESLRKRQLLEPWCRKNENAEARPEIEEELRYRVRPLLTGAIVTHLKGLNIVH